MGTVYVLNISDIQTIWKTMLLFCALQITANPPYMGNGGMDEKLSVFVKDNYPDSKNDLFAVFIERIHKMLVSGGYQAMITQHAWMFLTSFEKLRIKLQLVDIVNMAHLGARAFEEIGGEVVQTTTFVLRNSKVATYKGIYCRLIEPTTQKGKEDLFLSRKQIYLAQQDNFSQIPGTPVAYWVSDSVYCDFKQGLLSSVATTKQGFKTGDNERFLRLWFEPNIEKVSFNGDLTKKWFPCTKGGEFRRWYGNYEYVVNWDNDGSEIKNFVDERGKLRSRPQNLQINFTSQLTWSSISSGFISFRFAADYFMYESKGPVLTPKGDYNFLLGYINSNTYQHFIQIVAPTLDYSEGSVIRVPFRKCVDTAVPSRVKECVSISRQDWDSFETSWDFQVHPFVRWNRDRHNAQTILPLFDQYNKWKQANPDKVLEYDLQVEAGSTVELSFNLWRLETFLRFQQLKANEEELNRIFIGTYGLQNELTPEVADKDVTVRQANLGRDIRSLISYAVGCMLGRYSLDKPGLAYAGGEWDAAQYVTYLADKDGVLPITDDDYFSDDVVSMFVDWVKTVFGTNELEDNLKFIATALYPNGGGTARELIRQYFLNDFYKDHLKIYQKRPIYWLFDAGKKNSFKCLIYLHRYQPDTVARVRTDYVHEMQARYRTAMEDLTHRVETTSGSERVRLQKQLVKIQGQEEELRKYEEKIHHYADMMLPLDLDDGVKVNYAKLADVLAPIK